jgi:hypothetical protein
MKYGLQIVDAAMETSNIGRMSYCGSPYMRCCHDSPRYIIPALATALGGTPAAWQAASWTVLSSTPKVGDIRAYWHALWSNARNELRQRD